LNQGIDRAEVVRRALRQFEDINLHVVRSCPICEISSIGCTGTD
jgi:hypothetical protein